MEHAGSEILLEVLIFLLAAVVVVPVARKLRSSPVLGYMAAGIVVGPWVLKLITHTDSVKLLAELGIVFLLFAIGLELSVERLKVLRRFVFGLGALQVVVTAVVIALIVMGLGVEPEAAVVIGGGLALSSTAFVLQMLVERGELAARFGRVSFSILLFQDLAIVPLLALVPLLASDGTSLGMALGLAGAKATAAVVVTILIGRLALRPLFRVVANARSPELFVATTLLVLLATALLMEQAGVSMALGAFLAGLLLSGTEFRHQVEADIRPFKGLLLGLFFMSVGLAIDLMVILQNWAVILVGLLALVTGKGLILAGLCRLFKLPAAVTLRVAFLLGQGGEFGFVLIGSALALQLISGELAQLVVAVVALSMAVTPFVDFLGRRLSSLAAARDAGRSKPPTLKEEESEDLHDHVVIAGFGRVGQTVASVMSASHISWVGFDLNAQRVRHCHGRNLPVFYGDAGRVDVLETASLERARAAVITLDDMTAANHVVEALRAKSPDLPIMVRAHDLSHQSDLEAVGATAVVPETIEASLQLGGILLERIGVSHDEISRVMAGFRDDNYQGLQRPMDDDGKLTQEQKEG
ncbi:monovalent cation:proton antiporter-2 (CPA2) family protein [Rhodovibrionaceae bacterium A322]